MSSHKRHLLVPGGLYPSAPKSSAALVLLSKTEHRFFSIRMMGTFPQTLLEIAVALPVYGSFSYALPPRLRSRASIGKRVMISFGNRRVTGYILGPAVGEPPAEIKPIEDVLDSTALFPKEMIPFFRWIADYYLHPLGDVIKTALPGGLNRYDFTTYHLAAPVMEIPDHPEATASQKEILTALEGTDRSRIGIERLLGRSIASADLQTLIDSGAITVLRRIKGERVRPKTERFVRPAPLRPASAKKLSRARETLLALLEQAGEMSLTSLKMELPSATGLVKRMEKDGYLSVDTRQVYRDPFGEPISRDTPPPLTAAQQHAVAGIERLLERGFWTCLLAGVTGSGKTEVYLRLARAAIDRGLGVLVLVPEIALISQTERRFRARFGEKIALLHSGLSDGERYDQWLRIVRGQTPVAVGARSAVFAPFDKLGLVIVDEEHDPSYKQESALRYNARDLAVVRAKLAGCVALLGSATPSVQSSYNVHSGKYAEYSLPERVHFRPLPRVKVVDLRPARDMRGIRRFISPELQSAMAETLAARQQVLLFINRRGFAGFPVCAACGGRVGCKNCDISLTLHKKAHAFKCHYCGYTRAETAPCASCGSSSIKKLGLGTEKIEEAVAALFPQARVARMDRDTTRHKHSLLKILKRLRRGEIDILVGTQMVAKGHDFPNITLVGVICADLSLNFPDFRAGERTFQLLAQVAGRAGRGDVPGRVVLQTYNPEHFCIRTAVEQDYRAFFKHEIDFRQVLNYPPFCRLIQILISGKEPQGTSDRARQLAEACRELLQSRPDWRRDLTVMGPVEAPVARIANRYRWQLLLKGNATALHHLTHRLMATHGPLFKSQSIRVAVDVDPLAMT